MFKYETKEVKTSTLKYAKRIRIGYEKYENGNLYVGLYTMKWEQYSDITTNLGIELSVPLGYVEANSEAERFIKEQNLGVNLNRSIKSGFNTYNLYKFNPLHEF